MAIFGKILLAALAATPVLALAAEQCVNISGTYGAVDVTTSCTGQPYQTLIPSPLSINGRNSVLLTDPASDGPVSCTFTFSKPLDTASVRLYIDGQDNSPGVTEERTEIQINGSTYTVTPANLVGPLAGALSLLPISAVGGLINGAQPAGSASGTFSFASDAPAAITSFTMTYSGDTGTTIYSLCVDDADFAIVAVSPIPTLSQWGLIGLAALLAMAGALRGRTRRLPVA